MQSQGQGELLALLFGRGFRRYPAQHVCQHPHLPDSIRAIDRLGAQRHLIGEQLLAEQREKELSPLKPHRFEHSSAVQERISHSRSLRKSGDVYPVPRDFFGDAQPQR